MDIFETRTMLEALEQMQPAQTFFLDKFFRETKVSPTRSVDIDIVKGRRRLAPFVNRKLQGKLVEREGFETFTYTPPYIKPKMVTTAADILKRAPGNHIYMNNKGPAELAQEQLGKDLAELDEMITRREEWMAAMALQTGKVSIVGEGVEDEIDFHLEASHLITLTGTDLWSDAAATPIEDLEDWAEIILQDSGLVVDTIVMGKDAARSFMNNSDVQKKMDNLRMLIGQIAPTKIAPGARYLGTVNAVADIYVYHEWYYDETTETEKPLMDPKSVLLGSTQARCVRNYGAIEDLECPASVPRFPKSWVEKDPSGQILLVQSAPLPTPHQVDGFLCAKVLS